MTPRRFASFAVAVAVAVAAVVVVVTVRPAAAQQPMPLTLRGVPQGTPSATPLPLTLQDAIQRGLQQNLAAVLEEQQLKGAESTRLEALSALLPHVGGYLRQSEQKISTASFGFQFPGVPTVIGPFDVFDARLQLSTPLFDARAISGVRAGKALVKAGQAGLRDVRETIVLAVGTLYLQAQADAARVESTRAQVTTAEALVGLATDQKAAGIVAGIDVLRQQVQLQSARARLISAENVYEKRKLSLARAIGLPGGQAFTLASRTTFHAAPPLTLDQAVAEATAAREDVKAAQARVDAARYTRDAESAARWPSLHLDADLGTIGRETSALDRTYAVAALVRVPVFEGGETRARVQRAQADLRIREAELADLTGSIRYDVSAALLDVRAADAGVEVAGSARTLSQQELDQAQDRFKAGVASTLELVQAQESVATATERYIESLYAHAVAKGTLTRALGQVESRFVALVGGEQ
jgi:outer membrane protein TolC